MKEIIFAESFNKKFCGMAEVTLVVDDAKDTLLIDYKKVDLTCRMFQSGESKYHINGD